MASPIAARSVAVFLIVTSTLALLGWSADVAWLIQPFAPFPPLRVAAALGMLCLGGGLLASTFSGCRWLAMAFACIAIFMGTVPLLQALGWSDVDETLGRLPSSVNVNWQGESRTQMPLSSAVLLLLGGAGLLALMSRRRGLCSSIVLAASGGVVMLLASTVIAGQVMGVLEGVKFGHVLGSSLQACTCAIMLATHFNALAWRKQARFSPPPAWLPLSVGTGALVTVLVVWRALLASEESHLMEQNRLAASSTRSALNRELMVAQRNLRRTARYGWAPDSTWSLAATQMVDDVEGFEMMVWTDSAGRLLASDRHSSPFTLSVVDASVRAGLADVQAPTESAWYLPVPGDPSRTMMVVPRCTGARCTDLFVGVINSTKVLGAVLADTVLGFEMAIGDGRRWFRSSAQALPLNPHSVMRESLLPEGPNWQLGVWPSARTAAVTPSTLSDLVLVLGLAVAVLLAIALRLTQSLSQSARREERDSLGLALQSATDGLWEWDVSTGAVSRSPELWVRLGYDPGANFRSMMDWLALVHPLDVSMFTSRLKDHLDRRTEAFDVQYRVRSAAGRWHDFVDRGRVVHRTSDGAPLRLLCLCADVTDRHHTEELCRQAETMNAMGRLAGRVAHEINNPLAGIQSAFLLIKDAIPTTHPHFRYVGAIEREVQRISHVTRQLYETYRPAAEWNTHAPVQAVVGDVIATLVEENRNVGVSISVELGVAAAVVKVPDGILRQCVHDLVQNAIEASPAGGRVTVSGTVIGDVFELRVRDTGPGVPVELRERIFERVVSARISRLSTGGTGFGLSMVRRALDAAGGSIAIVDADGGGAEFIARLSLAAVPIHGVIA